MYPSISQKEETWLNAKNVKKRHHCHLKERMVKAEKADRYWKQNIQSEEQLSLLFGGQKADDICVCIYIYIYMIER